MFNTLKNNKRSTSLYFHARVKVFWKKISLKGELLANIIF